MSQTSEERLRVIRDRKWLTRLAILAVALSMIVWAHKEEAKECAANPDKPCPTFSRH